MSVSAKNDEQLMAVMAVLWTLGSMAMLGPVGLTVATIVFVAAILVASCRVDRRRRVHIGHRLRRYAERPAAAGGRGR